MLLTSYITGYFRVEPKWQGSTDPVLFEIFKLLRSWSAPGFLNMFWSSTDSVLSLSKFPGPVQFFFRSKTNQFWSVVPCSKIHDWLEGSFDQSDWLKTYLLVCMVIIKSISSRNGKIAKKSRKFGIEQK